MKRLITLALCAIALCLTPAVVAQYTVQSGDNLWDLAEIHLENPILWNRIIEHNPFLEEPGRVFDRDGRTIVLIRPGETLNGLRELGITPTPVSFEELRTESQIPLTPVSVKAGFPWWWLLVAGAVVALAIIAWRNRRFFRNPTTSGLPIIDGGVRNDLSGHIVAEQRFDQMAQDRWRQRDPQGGRGHEQPVRISPIRRGFLNGIGTVHYRDGRAERRRFRNEAAYEARFRFPDEHEEDLVFLQGCANDVTYFGRRYQGYEFTSEEEVVSEPQPEPQPRMGPRPLGEQVQPGITTIVIGNQELDLPAGSRAQVLAKNRIKVRFPGGDELDFKARAPARRRPAAKPTVEVAS